MYLRLWNKRTKIDKKRRQTKAIPNKFFFLQNALFSPSRTFSLSFSVLSFTRHRKRLTSRSVMFCHKRTNRIWKWEQFFSFKNVTDLCEGQYVSVGSLESQRSRWKIYLPFIHTSNKYYSMDLKESRIIWGCDGQRDQLPAAKFFSNPLSLRKLVRAKTRAPAVIRKEKSTIQKKLRSFWRDLWRDRVRASEG